jgi:2-keto-myo-inositol isomerase
MLRSEDRRLPRREVLRRGGVCLGAAMAAGGAALAGEPSPVPARPSASFRYCLNTGTLRGHKLSLIDEVDLAAQTGYQAIEPWCSEIHEFTRQGGNLADLRKRIADRGLTVESTITMGQWIPDASEHSPQGIEAWRRDFDLVARLGGKRICAPPCGVAQAADRDLLRVAARYRRLLELGSTFGVVPQLELWGRAPVLSKLGEIAYVLAEAGRPDACAVLDVFHIYLSGSPPAGLRALSADSLHVFHLNDYPANPPRDRITDSSRVYPGDGVAPLGDILRSLRAIGFRGFLSLELFNETYWRQPPQTVARVGLEKMQASVARAT